MNKTKKIAVAAVSLVMAGTMAFGIAGCNNNKNDDIPNWAAGPSEQATAFVNRLRSTYNLTKRVETNNAAWEIANGYWGWLKDSVSEPSANGGNLSYAEGTTINIAIGHNNAKTGAFYGDISGNPVLPNGTIATSGALKPAVKAMQERLGVTFVNKYLDKSTSDNLKELMDKNSWGGANGADIATSDLSKAVTSANNNSNILNLGEYLDKMPNFKAFLENNPIVYLSLLQDGMKADGTGKKIYVAPYFDGNDDIERYCIIRQDWVEKLLDNDLSADGDTYKSVCTETAEAKGFMGSTGKYSVLTTNASGEGTFTLTKDYDAALAAAKSESTELGAAYKAIADESYTGDSGNIVDIMTAALVKNNEATGKQLVALYKAYINVAYKNGSNKAYTKLSDVFNNYNAAWDVDDLVAMLRIVKTNSANVGLTGAMKTTGIFPRDTSNDRTPDIIRLVGELYGERGPDSRYEATYIDANGKLQDMRNNASFYQALENFGVLAKEGLVAKYAGETAPESLAAGDLKGNGADKPGTGFMICDYSQTQTTQMFGIADDNDYLFAPINTPVSRWDDNSDGKKETIMRFTESWRATKTGGLTVAASVADNQDKLNAVLTFIDFLYSNDGQILTTYGPQSTTGNTNPNGFWYGTEVTNVNIDTVAKKVGGQYVVNEDQQDKYFCFNDTLYTGTLYKGKMTPTVTTATFNDFISKEGAGFKITGKSGSFTDYGRQVLGATLPMGVKDQSFENQLTAPRAAAAATKVSVSIANGTIKHPELRPTENPWYTVVPTSLPLDQDLSATLTHTNQQGLLKMTGSYTDKAKYYSIYHYIIFYGFNGEYKVESQSVAF